MIEFRRVTKEYSDGTVAVSEFELVAPSHRTTVLVGSSGCGKTTLLRMVNRMVEPTSGAVEIDGEDIVNESPVLLRRRIGYVMQNAGLLPHLTVAANVATVLRLNGQSRRESRGRALELMELVGLETAMADRYPSQLSGGQQQRVGVARALAADPNILLMDEPFGAVDPIVRAELQHELIRLQRELGKTVIFVTHDVDEAFLLGDQVAILAAGAQKLQVGTPNEIIASPANDFVRAFIGADRGKRELRIEDARYGRVLVDADGRIHGTLVEDGA